MVPRPRLSATGKRWVRVVACVAGLALVGGPLMRYVAVPWGVRRALAAGGLAPASFEIEAVGLGRLRLVNLSAGAGAGSGLKAGSGTAGPWLTAGAVDITYSAGDLASGRVAGISVRDAVWTVRVRDGAVDWGLTPPKSSGPIAIDLPLDRVSVGASIVRVEVGNGSYEVATELTLDSTAQGIRGNLSLSGLGSSLEVAASATANAGVLTVEIESARPAVFNVESSGISGTLESVSGRLRLSPDGSGGTVPEGSLSVRGGALRAGDVELTDLELGLAVRLHELELTKLTAVVGDGGTLNVAGFVLDPADPKVRTRITASNLSLAEWVPLVTGQHAAGQGRFGGNVDIGLDLSGGTVTLTELSGGLEAEPRHGFIQVSDADALGALLESQNPKFATDQVMRPLRDKIVAALEDFAFNELTVDLSRRGDHTVAGVYISGFGRHGTDPQGLNLTLDVHAQDTILQLASRMESLSKVKSAAGKALERFFETRAPPARPTSRGGPP